jgi:hypothetical protein
MVSIQEKIFFDSLLCLSFNIALDKVKSYQDINCKEVEVSFIDLKNKEYFERKNGYNEDFLRVVGVDFSNLLSSGKIIIYVAFEINELIEDK